MPVTPPTISVSVTDTVTTPPKPTLVAGDSRNRVCIGKTLIEAMGLEPYDSAYVIPNPTAKSVKITRYAPNNLGNYRIYVVDKSGNIRLEQSVLRQAGISNGVMYAVTGDSKQVEVRLA